MIMKVNKKEEGGGGEEEEVVEKEKRASQGGAQSKTASFPSFFSFSFFSPVFFLLFDL